MAMALPASNVAFVESRSKSEQAKPWDIVGSLVILRIQLVSSHGITR
jgi:hypothetical protein